MEDKGRVWLFENTYRKTDNQPVLTGSGEISKDVLKELVENLKEQKPEDGIVRLSCAAWEKVAKSGKPYTFITFELNRPKEPNKVVSSKVEVDEDEDIPF